MADKFLNLTGLTYYHNKIKALFATKSDVETSLDDKVDKVSGKGLSANDYTTTEKNKLSGIASGAQVNVIESVKVNGTAQTVTSKAVNITIPTKLSDLTNDGNFVTDENYVHTDNNYTTTEKNKLNGVASGAQVNVIESIKRNGTALTVTSKAVDISVPTKTSELTNDSDYVVDANYVHTDVNFTSALKSKLDGIAASAQVNKIETVKVNGTALTITSKAVDVTVPTKTSDLTNDSNFVADASYVHTDNNFTDTLLTKLNGIAAGATKVTVDSALSSTSTNPLQNKAINSALSNKAPTASPTFTGTPKAPTATAGTNTTQIATTEFVTTAVANAIGSVTQIEYRVVESLPATGENGVIYLVAHSHGTGDSYDEYVWVGNAFEKLGNTDIDLSGYMLKTDMVAITTSEIDALFA